MATRRTQRVQKPRNRLDPSPPSRTTKVTSAKKKPSRASIKKVNASKAAAANATAALEAPASVAPSPAVRFEDETISPASGIDLTCLPSSPLPPSSPPQPIPSLDCEYEVAYKLWVNSRNVVSRPAAGTTLWSFFDAEELYREEESMLEDSIAGLENKEYKVLTRRVDFRLGSGRPNNVSLADFSSSEVSRVVTAIEYALKKQPRTKLIALKVEIRVDCKPLEKAFKRNQAANEPSSDVPENTPIRPSKRTQQLINELRATRRVEELATQADWEDKIHNYWICKNERCVNRNNWCFVTAGGADHFRILPPEGKSWANAILDGTATIFNPPLNLIEYWRTSAGGGNQLNKKPLKKGKSRRRSSLSSSCNSSEEEYKREKRRQDRREKRRQQEEDEEWRREEREAIRLQREQLRLQRFAQPAAQVPAVPHHLLPPSHLPVPYGFPAQQQYSPYGLPIPQQPMTPTTAASVPINSSPVTGLEDTRATVKEFFAWLISKQPEEDQDDYKQAKEVAIEQKWTIEDLREMSNPSRELYKIAVSEPHKLKDGIVRHFRADLRKFKQSFRAKVAAESLQSLYNVGRDEAN